MQAQQCSFCGHTVELIHVHGHYQCPICKTNALPCCDGDNCETNKMLESLQKGSQEPMLRDIEDLGRRN